MFIGVEEGMDKLAEAANVKDRGIWGGENSQNFALALAVYSSDSLMLAFKFLT
jgi:hypothetical protein